MFKLWRNYPMLLVICERPTLKITLRIHLLSGQYKILMESQNVRIILQSLKLNQFHNSKIKYRQTGTNRDINRLDLISEKISFFILNPTKPNLNPPYCYKLLRQKLFDIALIRRSNYEYYANNLLSDTVILPFY